MSCILTVADSLPRTLSNLFTYSSHCRRLTNVVLAGLASRYPARHRNRPHIIGGRIENPPVVGAA
eukprot:3727125-Pyramimonas_sp.AAC.1